VWVATCYGGYCTPSSGSCTEDLDCPGGFVCIDGECLRGSEPIPCTSAFECATGQYCRGGFCQDGGDTNQCTTGDDCPGGGSGDDVGQACIAGVCSGSLGSYQTCGGNDDVSFCPAGTACTSGYCLPAEGACNLDGDCGDGESCMRGWCGVACEGDSGCAAGETCALGRCAAVCTDYSQCAAHESCFDGGCVPTDSVVSSLGGSQDLWSVDMPGSSGDVQGGCSTGGSSGSLWLMLALFAPMALRKRRRA
jgi:hypothetical protein